MRFEDDRGYLEIIHETKEVVVKRSFSRRNVFRGMHYQAKPYQQTKLIRVIRGSIIDFQLFPELSTHRASYIHIKENPDWINIDSSVAHGFLALEDTLFEYICIGAYNEDYEECYNIAEPVKKYFSIENLILSNKDRNGTLLDIKSFKQINVE